MPSTAPTLTWDQTALSVPATNNVVQDVLDALSAALGNSTPWEVKSSAAGYIEAGPVAGGAQPNLRVIIATGVNVGQVLAPHTTATAGVLFMGLAPEGGANTFTAANVFLNTSPYNAGRWTGYWKVSGVITGADNVDAVRVLASDEVLSFWFGEATANNWWGGIAGCLLDPPDDADGEGTPGRIYGMACSGSDVISANFWQNTADFLDSGTGSIDPCIGCFTPTVPATWSTVDRLNNAGGADAPYFTTISGTRVSIPVGYNLDGGGDNFIGWLRQIRKTQDGRMGQIIQNGAAADQAYIVAGNDVADEDAASFDNG